MEGFKINLIRSEEHFQSYCNKIFAGWDFCITNRSMADLKHSSLRYELRVSAAQLSQWELGLQPAEELVGAGLSCLGTFPCKVFKSFLKNYFLRLITLAPSIKLVNWSWAKRWYLPFSELFFF